MKAKSALIIASLLLAAAVFDNTAVATDDAARGRGLAFARDKGNCLACHLIAGGDQMGDIGPPLVAMAARFPDRERLRRQIWDAGDFNERSLMPPFGRHGILDGAEIDAIIDFLYTL
jgi:sulfur-oxidizing protein SoxX